MVGMFPMALRLVKMCVDGGFKEGEWRSDVCVGQAGGGWSSMVYGLGLEPLSVVRLWGSRISKGGCCIHLDKGDVGM